MDYQFSTVKEVYRLLLFWQAPPVIVCTLACLIPTVPSDMDNCVWHLCVKSTTLLPYMVVFVWIFSCASMYGSIVSFAARDCELATWCPLCVTTAPSSLCQSYIGQMENLCTVQELCLINCTSTYNWYCDGSIQLTHMLVGLKCYLRQPVNQVTRYVGDQ